MVDLMDGGFDNEAQAEGILVKGWDVWVVGVSGGVEERVMRGEAHCFCSVS